MLEKNNIDTQVNRINSTGYPSFFLLDENAVFDVHSTYSLTASPRWMYPTHLKEARYSLVLTAGESLQSSEFCVFSDSRIYLRFSAALPEISLDGLTCSLSFLDVCGNARLQIGTFEVLGGTACSGWRIVELDLSWLAGASGRLLVECGPGPENDPTADWLALSDICISRMHEQKVLLARTHHEVRVKNEIAHFSAAYRNELYSKVQDRQSQATGGVVRNIRQLKAAVDIQLGGNVDMKIMEPTEGEAAYTYATRLLRTCLADSPPDYKARLREKVKHHGTLKVLSLCSGAARIEAGFAAAVPDGIEWSLLDINEDLLHMAAKQFSPQTPLDLIVANANELSPTGERWDVIICVSALHHLVEL
ncbi:MAG: class SAM-dependent methyltransferase [Pseudomonas sp.]|nr:class SAM-dependent methyltransferase [Pseudomonas sp.]